MKCIFCREPLTEVDSSFRCSERQDCPAGKAELAVPIDVYPDPYTPIIEGCEAALAELAPLAYQHLGNAPMSGYLAGRKAAFEQVIANVQRYQRGD